MTEPHKLLARAFAGLENDNLSDECRKWLADGLGRVLAGDSGLDECLHLQTMHGKPTASTAALRDRRDGLICALAFVLPGGIMDKAVKIADLLAGRAPDVPDSLASELLMKIHEIDPSPPKSKTQIWRILDGNRSR